MLPDARRWAPLGLLARVGSFLLLAYAVFIGGGYVGTQATVLRTLSLGLIALALTAWVIVSLRDPRWRPRSSIWPAIVVSLGTLAVSTTLSRYPRLGLEYVAWAVLLGPSTSCSSAPLP